MSGRRAASWPLWLFVVLSLLVLAALGYMGVVRTQELHRVPAPFEEQQLPTLGGVS